MTDVASQVAELVREARQKYNDTLPSYWLGKRQYGHRQVLDWYGYLELCDALEEREREVERQDERLWRAAGELHEALDREGQLQREVERLRQQLKICTKALDKACRDGGKRS